MELVIMKVNRQKLFWTVVFLISLERVQEGDAFMFCVCAVGLLLFHILDKLEEEYEKSEKEDYVKYLEEEENEDKLK